MRQLAVAVALSTWILAGGCQSDTSDPSSPGDPAGGPDDPIVQQYSLSWGPVTVAPGQESTQCIWLRLGNDTEIKVHQLHNVLGATSHHLIIYRDDMDTTEQPTPIPCQPFTGALNPSGRIFPVMITQKHDDMLTLPHHVAYTLAPHQMIKIEMHYLNPADATQQATAMIQFGAADPTAIHDEANILFIGSPDITLPSNAMTEVHEYFDPARAGLDLTGARFFAITGHTHKLGLSVAVGTASSASGAVTPVYAPDPFLWSEPATTVHQPEFTLPDGGGFDFHCRWYNSTPQTVTFGESASDEMCFFWAYYFPSNGSHVCAHATYHGVGFDLCCPEAGTTLCSLLDTSGK